MINRKKLEGLMLEMGHPEHLIGTGYIREGVELYHGGLVRMTTELYPEIARLTGSTPSRVERAMRHSIATAWQRGNTAAQVRVFGYSINPSTGVPTVGQYLARLARVCRDD